METAFAKLLIVVSTTTPGYRSRSRRKFSMTMLVCSLVSLEPASLTVDASYLEA